MHSMQAHRDSRGTSPLILTLGTRWGWVVNFMSRPLYPRKEIPNTDWIWGWSSHRDGLDI